MSDARPSLRGRVARLRARVPRRLRRMVDAAAPLLPLTAAATLAWVLARQVGDHDEPFFAPIAVVVALSSPLGERGSNAVRLLLGVMIGIVVGELTTLVLGDGYGRVAVATFTAMAIARVLRGPRLVKVQAAGAAILTVAAAGGEAGIERLVDGGIGAAVALTFSQVLLSPEPVALVRRAAADALGRIAEALSIAADALESSDRERAADAVGRFRALRDSLGELARLRKASSRVARRSAIWRSRIAPTVRETENAGHLDLLSNSGLLLSRTIGEADLDACEPLAPSVRRLAEAVARMAVDPGDRGVRQGAADDALVVAGDLAGFRKAPDPGSASTLLALRMVTVDVMIVAGVEPDEALAAVEEGSGAFEVPAPPKAPRLPFGPGRLPHRRS